MATLSTYVSGHTEAGDVAEFFQKQMLNAGERPLAFFDGVFYESHQERIGNIAYQDYLIYSDRAVYLWARGANKDYLDRFVLGAVSINSRKKDNDFATLNFRIRREGREPVYVIFDMVEVVEAEKINTLHTIIESIIENSLGNNFREEIPDEIAEQVFQSARNTCPPVSLSFNSPEGQAPITEQNSCIGYGQDLLEQYKASIGYTPEDVPETEPSYGLPPGSRRQQQQQGAQEHVPGIPKGFEGILPTDPEALKRIAANLRDAIGEAPFKFRDQVMKDLQHVPNDVATILTAINELVLNIADNPKAEKFVLNAIQTAVKNDGILGSVGKMLKLTTGLGPGGKKPSMQQSSGRSAGGAREPGEDLPAPDDRGGQIRRKKVKIHSESDDEMTGLSGESLDKTLEELEATMLPASGSGKKHRKKGVQRGKKVNIVAEEPESPDAGPVRKASRRKPAMPGSSSAGSNGENKVKSRKIKVTSEDDALPQSVEEQLRKVLKDVGSDKPEPDISVIQEEKKATRKKAAVKSESVEESEAEKKQPKVYRAIESEPGQEEDSGSEEGSAQKRTVEDAKPRRPVKKGK